MKKIKIFVYNSSHKKHSHTQLVIDKLLGYISSSIEIEICSHSALCDDISQCIGCEKCFYEGKCPLDDLDSMKLIKKDLIEADIIILGTPVYSAMVSGNMKIFMDRLSYYLHLLTLRGKIIIPIISSSSNSLIETNEYLVRIAESWGGSVPFSILFTVDAPNMIESKSFTDIKIKEYAHCLLDYCVGKQYLKASDYQEIYYNQLKKSYFIPNLSAEYLYWKNNGLLNYKNYQEILDEMKN